MATRSNIGRKRYKKAKAGDVVKEWIGGSLMTYVKGTEGDFRRNIQGSTRRAASPVVQQTEQASKDYSAELRKISQDMLDAADPFRAQRQQYADKLSDLYKDPSSITESASYKFRFGQGQKALERSMAAKGMLGSGNLGLELQRYGQEMASTEFDKEVSRLGTLAGAAPGSPAAGAQLASGLLSGAAGEDFNRGGYAAYADALSGSGLEAPVAAITGMGQSLGNVLSENNRALQVAGGSTLGDPFAPIAPPGPSNRLGGATTAPAPPASVSASPQPEVDAARATSGWTSYSPAGGTAGVAPGTGTFTSSTGGAGTFGGGAVGGGAETPLGIDFEETGSEGEQFGGPEFSIWGTHF